LRSGGATGADSAFARGAADAAGAMEIYLPEKGYRGHPSPLFKIPVRAVEIAAAIHPAWRKCRPLARRFHARNVLQVLGADLATPTHTVVCWTEGGEAVGGTATAILLAERHGIPVVNLAILGPEELEVSRLAARIEALAEGRAEDPSRRSSARP
jgi:hypothetical protein